MATPRRRKRTTPSIEQAIRDATADVASGSEREPYGLTSPCADCPFRRDVTPYIRARRVLEIEEALERAEFPCHKTTDLEDEDPESEHIPGPDEMHCAGALILLEKLKRPSQMMRISERVGLYDSSKLNMAAPVYASFREMYRACEAEESKRRAASRKRRRTK